MKFLQTKAAIANTLLRWLLPVAFIVPLFAEIIFFDSLRMGVVPAKAIILCTLLTILLFLLFVILSLSFVIKEELNLRKSEALSRLLVENRKDYAIFMLS